MKDHYTEADLLETYYTQPGESMPVMMHLAGCIECSARYERLDRKIRESAACHTEKDEGFWALQRARVMSRVQGGGRSRFAAPLRVAAAALLAVVIGGGLVLYQPEKFEEPTVPVQAEAVEERIPSDPWQSDELEEFGSVVQWETWIENGEKPL
jgi:hypothetical protein